MAATIARLKTREERRAALEQVPPQFQALVRTQVTNTLLLANHWRDRIARDPFVASECPESVFRLLRELDIVGP